MTGPRILKRRPTTVEAWQVTLEDGPAIAAWAGGDWAAPHGRVLIRTDTDDWAHAGVGDWIVKGPFGDFYPAADRVMAANYEAVLAVHAE